MVDYIIMMIVLHNVWPHLLTGEVCYVLLSQFCSLFACNVCCSWQSSWIAVDVCLQPPYAYGGCRYILLYTSLWEGGHSSLLSYFLSSSASLLTTCMISCSGSAVYAGLFLLTFSHSWTSASSPEEKPAYLSSAKARQHPVLIQALNGNALTSGLCPVDFIE